MATHYVLIDYENVQPKNLAALKEGREGPRLPRHRLRRGHAGQDPAGPGLRDAVLRRRGRVHRGDGERQDALDFHIAYYLGKLARSGSEDHFHVVSRDTGFDVLIKHLQSQGINVDRRKGLFEIPWIEVGESDSFGDQVDKVVHTFDLQGKSRPRKVRTVRTTINALFGKGLTTNNSTRW